MICLAITLAVLAAQPAAPELPAKLTLGEALRLFRERGLDLLLADAQVQSAQADQASAAAVPNPNASAGVGRSFNYDPSCQGCSALQLSVGLSDNAALSDSISGKRGLRKDVAAHALAAAKLGRADAQRTLELLLKQVYLQSVLARAQLRFAEETEQTFARTQGLQREKLRLGAISDADLARVDVAALEALQARDQAAQALRAARAQLGLLLGVRGLLPDFDVDEAALSEVPEKQLESRSRAELLQAAEKNRPDLLAFDEQIKRAESSIALARRQRWPDPSVSLTYSQEGSGQSAITPPTLTLGLSMGLPIFYQQQGEIGKAISDLRTQTLQRQKLQAQLASDLEVASGQLQTASSLLARMRSGLLARAKKARDLVEVQYEKGAATLLELLDAERTYIAIHGEYLQDLTGYWTAVAQLEAVTALELRQ